MIPIYEQGDGRGIGLNLKSFLNRFDAICKDHIREKRAVAFGFIFYDFDDKDLRRILRDQGVFTQLDRLAGSKLSLFYLHAGRRRSVSKFNEVFLSRLDLPDTVALPCVVFFKLGEDTAEDIAVAQLESTSSLHGFHELHEAIKRYIDAEAHEAPTEWRALKWLRAAGRMVALETFKTAIQDGVQALGL